MDLLDFSDCKLYFEDELPAEAERLIAQAAQDYGDPAAELALLRHTLPTLQQVVVTVTFCTCLTTVLSSLRHCL